MKDWALDYLLHVMTERGWSANRLAREAGLATSTIARPLREPDYKHSLSRTTITKVAEASGIDPAPFIPEGFAEDKALFQGSRPRSAADLALERLDQHSDGPNAQTTNEIKIAVVGRLAQIVATIDRAGIAKLRAKLDAIESMLDD